MDEFLAGALTKMNKFTREELDQLSFQFRAGLTNNYMVFGKHSFRKHSEGQTGRSVLNASLWDVMSTGLSRYPEEWVHQRAQVLRDKFYTLMKDPVFIDAITYSPNSTKNVRLRFDIAEAMFREVFRADAG
jgi:hypothetical protein